MKILLMLGLQISLLYAQSGLDSLLKNISGTPDTTKIKILNDYTWNNRNNRPYEALRSGEEALTISIAIKNNKLRAKSLNLIGVVYRNIGNYEKALGYYKNALHFSETAGDSSQIAYSYNNIGGIYRLVGNYPLTLEYVLKALKIFESMNDKEGMAFCTINIGLVYKNQEDYSKALEYLNYTLKLRNEINDKAGKALALNLIAETYVDIKKTDIALQYYYQSENEYKEIGDQKGLSAVWGGIGGIFYSQNLIAKALEYRLRALNLSYKIGYIEGQIAHHNNLALIYAKRNDTLRAENNLRKALSLANGLKAAYIQLECYRYWSQYYEMKKDYKSAFGYNKKYVALKDSLLSQENISLVKSMESVYKAEKTEKENAILLKDIELKEKQRNYLIIIVLLVVAISLVTYSRYQSKKIANENLKELNTVKDTFFKIIAHDLKTPFNAIFGYTELLKKDFDKLSDSEKLSCIDDISRSAKQNFQLLENLLMWAQSQSGKLEFNPKKLDVKKIIENSADLLFHLAKNKSVALEIECGDVQEITADEQMMKTVFRNLISNGIKFSNPNGKVVISANKENDKIRFSVKDSGVGINDETKQKLFTKNRVASTTGTQGERGTGLGLVLCKDFIEMHGGKIHVESQPGEGSEFIFTLAVG
ncbi:MAG: tetratricopeptide repeat-containing sensor histidine kinase [Ignavibacteriales bacterium]|nr:tetratricopeptide repeat-containing sensor histidine kinase [Ignavibacteriales bacterium]